MAKIYDDRQLEQQEMNLQEQLRLTKKQRRAEKKRKKSLPKTTADIIPFRYMKSENCFVLKNGMVTDFVQISGVPMEDLHDTDKQLAINQFHAFLKQYDEPFKLIYQTFPADSTEQLHYLNHKIRKNLNPIFQPFLEHKRWELEEMAKQILHQEFYFQIFAEDEEELEVFRRRVLNVQYSYFRMNIIPFEKKMKMLFKLNNMNTAILRDVEPMTFYPDTPPEMGYDPVFLSYIQPRGNMRPNPRYLEKGDGFETCIHIVEYNRDARPFWGRGMFNKPNVVTIQDTMTIPREKLLKAVNDSAQEHEHRHEKATNRTDKKLAEKEYSSLDSLVDEVVDSQETVKELHTRLFVFAPTKSKLEDQVADIIGELTARGFRGMIQLSEMEEDYQALFTSYKTQYEAIPRHGQDIKSGSLAGSYAFDFSYLADPHALYCGNTFSGGAVTFSHFHQDESRMSYNMLICGVQGSGKSTTLKKIALSRVILGDQVFIFSVSKEFDRLCEAVGGVCEDASDSAVNILQVFATCVDENTLETLVDKSFSVHLDKIQLVYRFLSEEHVPEVEKELKLQLRRFYHEWCRIHHMDMAKITDYASNQYPILRDFYHYLLRILYQDIENKVINTKLEESEIKRLQTLIFNIYSIIENYGMFNQHTKATNIEDAPMVVYNIETMLKMNQGALNAQLFNTLNVFWDIMIRKGQIEKGKHDRRESGPYDYIYRTLILDEFKNWTRSAYIEQLNLLDRFSREARKYFGSLILASQEFTDMLPKASESSQQGKVDEVMNQIFALATYKMFMRQGVDSVDAIRKWYGKVFSESELAQIPHLKKGQAIMNISGTRNISFKWDISEQEDFLFTGGL